MVTDEEKQNARDFRKSKRSGGLLTKLGTGKIGRYGKAAMLTAGLMNPHGPSGGSAFSEEGRIRQAMRMNNRSAVTQQYQTEANEGENRFSVSQNPQYYSATISSDSSGISIGDEAAIRRRLGKERLQAKKQKMEDIGRVAGGAVGAAIGERYAGPVGKFAGRKAGEKIGKKAVNKSVFGRWAKLKNRINSQKEKIGELEGLKSKGDIGVQVANEAAKKAVQAGWVAVHETIDDTFWSLFPIILLVGFVPILVILLRYFGWLVAKNEFSINIKGVKVQIFVLLPIQAELLYLARALIMLVIWLGTLAIIIAIVYAVYEHPAGTFFDILWSWIEG